MPECPPGNFPARICDLEEAVRQLQAGAGHPPASLTNADAPFSWNEETQTGNIPQFNVPATPAPEVVVTANSSDRAALAPQKLNQLLIQTSDVTNGNFSVWAATGTSAGNWTLKTGSLAAQNASSVNITGGVISGITDLAVADGGTGASTPAAARVNLAVASNVLSGSAVDWLVSNNFFVAIVADTTFTFTNPANGLVIEVAVSAPTGSTTTWPAGVKWPGGSAPAHSGSGKTDVFRFAQINGVIYGSVVANYTT